MSLPSIVKFLLLSTFCCALVAVRIHATDTAGFIYLPFNLALAWIPLLMAWLAGREQNKILLFSYLFLWLIFFPNAPYIITDLVHLKPRSYSPIWFDSFLLYSFAFTGLSLGMFSAITVYQRLKKLMAPWKAKACMLFTMLLSGYAIYLGRFLRWNSWDVLLNPLAILNNTLSHLLHPAHHPQVYSVTLVIGIMMCLVFLLFESFTVQKEQ